LLIRVLIITIETWTITCGLTKVGFGSQITNSIIWDNGYSAVIGDPVVTYSDIEGGFTGDGNINTDPCFVDANNGDYHLKSNGWRWDSNANEWTWDDVTSRCIDAGNPGSVLSNEPITLDVDLLNRWGVNKRINIGAYGRTVEASMPPYYWALLSDITNDGICDNDDLASLTTLWLNTGEELYADFNRNGMIDFADFVLLAEVWLETTSWQ